MIHYTKHIFICTNQKSAGRKCCANSGGDLFFDHMKLKLKEQALHGAGQFRVSKSGCLGRCSEGPSIVIYPEGVWYTYASFADIDEIIATHLVAKGIVERLLLN